MMRLAHELPTEKLVVFLYKPSHRPFVAQLLRRVESSLEAIIQELYMVYYDAFWADVFHASTTLERRFAAPLPYPTIKAKSATARRSQTLSWCGKIAATHIRAHRRTHDPGLHHLSRLAS
jgi:hypothetical protein